MYKNASRFRQHRTDTGHPLGHGLGRYAGAPGRRPAQFKRKPPTPTILKNDLPRVTKPKRAKPQPQGLRISESDLLLLRECLTDALRVERDPKRHKRLTGITAKINHEIAEQRR